MALGIMLDESVAECRLLNIYQGGSRLAWLKILPGKIAVYESGPPVYHAGKNRKGSAKSELSRIISRYGHNLPDTFDGHYDRLVAEVGDSDAQGETQ